MFGKLSWDAIPTTEPIVMYTLAVVGLIGVALVGSITWKRKWGYLWREWFTSVDHKKIGCMYIIVALVMLLRGFSDAIMMRTVDILLAIPYMFVLILLLVVFGRSLSMLFLGIGLISWLEMSRIVRGQTLSLKNREFIEAARATGVPAWKIILRHIVPNLLGVVAVYATLLVPLMILSESFISFLGLGVQEPLTSWGALISEGAATMSYGTLWQLVFPLFFFCITLFAFFFVGDGLRDALDPKDR